MEQNKPRTILVVAKDLSSGKVTLPIAETAAKQGHNVIVVTEGLATAAFFKAGFTPAFVGTVNNQEVPFTLDVDAFLKKHAPDVVVTGQSVPIHLEPQFVTAARKQGIPVATIEDTWGGSLRMEPPTDLSLVVDEYSASLARVTRPDQRFGVIGHIGRPTDQQMATYCEPLPEITKLRESYDKIILYVGGGVRTDAEIKLLIECLAETQSEWCLVARFHPKWVDKTHPEGDGKTYGEVWNRMLEEALGDRYQGNLSSVKVTECLTANSDIVVGSFTNLTVAALAGKVPITFSTPEGTAELLTPYGLTETPHVALGLAHEVAEPCDLSTFGPSSVDADSVIVEYDSWDGYQLIMSLIKPKAT